MIIPYRKVTKMKKEKDHYKLLRLQDERIQQLETIISSQKEEITLLRELAEQLKEKSKIQEQYITKLHGPLWELGLSGNED